MDDNEFDIYDDLDVFEGSEKQQKECAECTNLRDKLNHIQQQLEQLRDELTTSQKLNATQLENNCNLLTTAREEIQRKDGRLKDLTRERDDFCFRRRKPPNVQTRETSTQSAITCKPFSCYELRRVDDETSDKSIERIHRRDENPAKNPFTSKSKENNEMKTNQKNTDKNSGGHRNQTRHQDEHKNLRGKHTNQRNKDDERRSKDEQLGVDRLKRKRSRSLSKDRKRGRRSRSRSRSRPKREKERSAHERNSPVRTSRNQPPNEKNGKKEKEKEKEKEKDKDKGKGKSRRSSSPQRPSEDLRYQLRNKRTSDELEPTSRRHSRTELSETRKRITKSKDRLKTSNESGKSSIQLDVAENVSKSINVDSSPLESVAIKNEPLENYSSGIEPVTNIVHARVDALEEGEIDDEDSNGVIEPNLKESEKVISLTNNESSNDIRLEPSIDIKKEKKELVQVEQDDVVPMTVSEVVILSSLEMDAKMKIELKEEKEENVKNEVKEENEQLLQLSTSTDLKTEINSENTEKSLPNAKVEIEDPISKVENYIAKLPIILNNSIETTNVNTESSSCLSNSSTSQVEPETENIQTENAEAVNQTEQESVSHVTEDLGQHENSQKNDSKENTNISETIGNKSFHGLDGVLNSSGNKSVNVISTSSKDYVFVEDENNETTVYITRKKKKKKDKKKTVRNV